MGIGQTVRVSIDGAGGQYDLPDPEVDPEDPEADTTANVGLGPAISGDGQYVAFESLAPLTPDDVNEVQDVCEEGDEPAFVPMSDVYRFEFGTRAVTRWSLANPDGTGEVTPTEASGFKIDGHTGECVPASNGADAAISRDGSRIAFVSGGNLVGRVVEEEEGEVAALAAVGEPIEPNIYVHRPHPEPDIMPPASAAASKAYVNTNTMTVRYRASDAIFPWTGVDRVQLWGKKPGDTEFTKLRVDIGDEMDNLFTVASKKEGLYRFYTVAKDVWGNWEAVPKARDTVTEKDSVLPTISKEKVVPNPFDISRDDKALLSMRISEKAATTFLVKDNGIVVKRFDTELSPRGLVQRYWRGRNDAGNVVRSGHYVVVMKAKDLAGNLQADRVGLDVTR
jgi:hypothetical protein